MRIVDKLSNTLVDREIPSSTNDPVDGTPTNTLSYWGSWDGPLTVEVANRGLYPRLSKNHTKPTASAPCFSRDTGHFGAMGFDSPGSPYSSRALARQHSSVDQDHLSSTTGGHLTSSIVDLVLCYSNSTSFFPSTYSSS